MENPDRAYIPPHTLEAMKNLGCPHGKDPQQYTKALKIGRIVEPDDRPEYAKHECSECEWYEMNTRKPWKGRCRKRRGVEVRWHEVACKRFQRRRK